MVDKTTWKSCALCGEKVHPLQESSASPLADGIACVSCSYGRVWPTIRNGGKPSHLTYEYDSKKGKFVSKIVADRR